MSSRSWNLLPDTLWQWRLGSLSAEKNSGSWTWQNLDRSLDGQSHKASQRFRNAVLDGPGSAKRKVCWRIGRDRRIISWSLILIVTHKLNVLCVLDLFSEVESVCSSLSFVLWTHVIRVSRSFKSVELVSFVDVMNYAQLCMSLLLNHFCMSFCMLSSQKFVRNAKAKG